MLLSIIACFAGCSKVLDVEQPDTAFTRSLSKRVTASQTDFAFDLLKTVAKDTNETGNIFLSPISASLALTMTMNGADGETWEEMRQTLGYDNADREEINATCRALIEELYSLCGDIEFNLAHSIWFNDNFTLQDEFQRLNRDYFQAMIETLDFSRVDYCVNTINSWVEAQTRDRIQDLVKPDDISPLTMMLLINAVYFKANWQYQFDPEDTGQDDFDLPDGSSLPCEMMKIKGKFDYYADDDLQAIDLPYANEHYSMTILLPKAGSTDSLLQRINQSDLNNILGSMQQDSVNVFLPKFELEYEKSLVKALMNMGMIKAFGAADFSRMFQEIKEGIFISEVRQKSFLKVEETGTEAAAATVVIIKRSGVNDEIMMRIDHPFLLFIREKRSGTILFCGKIIQPA